MIFCQGILNGLKCGNPDIKCCEYRISGLDAYFTGYFCLVETVDPEICPSGYYCPEGTEFAAQFPCPAGTYNNNTG